MNRVVVLKVLNPKFLKSHDAQQAVQSFLHEQRLLVSCSGPGIIPIFDAGVTDGIHYLCLRHAEYGDLDHRILRHGRLRDAHLKAIITDALRGLQRLHHQGILHRDIKASNLLMVQDDRLAAVWGDLGIAWDMASPCPDVLVGTTAYMAPEVLTHQTWSAASDLYSFGVMLWSVISGVKPYHWLNSEAEIIQNIVRGIPPIHNGITPPPHWMAMIAGLLEQQPRHRMSINACLSHVEGMEVSDFRKTLSAILPSLGVSR